MRYNIREMKTQEYSLVDIFLFEAIFQRDEENLLPHSITNEPDLHIYIKDFGKLEGDYCLCAEVNNKIIGAVWVRNIAGFGNIDNETPEFAISLIKAFRGLGIGTVMMKQMLDYLN